MIDLFVNEPGVSFMLHVYSGDVNYRTTHLYEDGAMLQPGLDPGQWVQVPVMKEIIVGPGTLWVSVEYETDNRPEIGVDSTHFDRYGGYSGEQIMYWFRTYGNSFGEDDTNPYTPITGHLMIKVQAEKLDVLAKKELVQISGSGTGLGFAVIAIGAGAAAAAGGLAVAISQPRSEVYAAAGHYYCRKHRTPVWSVEGRLWCPVEHRFLKP